MLAKFVLSPRKLWVGLMKLRLGVQMRLDGLRVKYLLHLLGHVQKSSAFGLSQRRRLRTALGRRSLFLPLLLPHQFSTAYSGALSFCILTPRSLAQRGWGL